MASSQWHFRKFAPGDNLSDPDFTKALFASDSDSAVARSLVREALQNSLDARAAGAERVHVRIAIHRPRWTPQIRPLMYTAKPATTRAG